MFKRESLHIIIKGQQEEIEKQKQEMEYLKEKTRKRKKEITSLIKKQQQNKKIQHALNCCIGALRKEQKENERLKFELEKEKEFNTKLRDAIIRKVILSQDKNMVFNWNNIIAFEIDIPFENNDAKFRILVETTNDSQYAIGEYNTKKRAMEVLQEMIELFEIYSIYEMPEK